jgi:NAD(P)-dependent dehydrogenase (short-subunit alcohol dehydrogenase family)
VLDLSETASIREVVNRAWAVLGRIDVVVSNAGYGLMGAAEELIDEQARREVDINLVGGESGDRTNDPHHNLTGGPLLPSPYSAYRGLKKNVWPHSERRHRARRRRACCTRPLLRPQSDFLARSDRTGAFRS